MIRGVALAVLATCAAVVIWAGLPATDAIFADTTRNPGNVFEVGGVTVPAPSVSGTPTTVPSPSEVLCGVPLGPTCPAASADGEPPVQDERSPAPQPGSQPEAAPAAVDVEPQVESSASASPSDPQEEVPTASAAPSDEQAPAETAAPGIERGADAT